MSVFNKSLSFLISNNTDFAELPVSYFRNLELSLYIYLLPPEYVEKEMQLMQVTSPAVFMSWNKYNSNISKGYEGKDIKGVFF